MKFSCKNALALSESMIQLSYFSKVIKADLQSACDKFVLITGENATGKSFVRRLVSSICRQEKIELIHVSQEGRSQGGFPMKCFIYGDENCDSTGYLTSKLVTTGISTCQQRDSDHFIFWDEPDIGLSDRYAAGVGVTINRFISNLPKHTRGVFVVTHSKPLVKQLLPAKPSHLRLGDKLTIQKWLDEQYEPGDLEELATRGHTMFKKISGILNKKRD